MRLFLRRVGLDLQSPVSLRRKNNDLVRDHAGLFAQINRGLNFSCATARKSPRLRRQARDRAVTSRARVINDHRAGGNICQVERERRRERRQSGRRHFRLSARYRSALDHDYKRRSGRQSGHPDCKYGQLRRAGSLQSPCARG